MIKLFNHFFSVGGGKVVDASQEMIALGFCNIFSSFMGSMPVAGSMTRSALNHTTGVRTTFSSIFTSKCPNIEPQVVHIVNVLKIKF